MSIVKTFQFTLDDEALMVQVSFARHFGIITVNGEPLPGVVKLGRLERWQVPYKRHMFTVGTGNAITSLGFDYQLWINGINVQTGKKLDLGGEHESAVRRVLSTALGFVCGLLFGLIALVILIFMFLFCYCFHHRRMIIIDHLPAGIESPLPQHDQTVIHTNAKGATPHVAAPVQTEKTPLIASAQHIDGTKQYGASDNV